MGGRCTQSLLVACIIFLAVTAANADLTVTGTKNFEYSTYSVGGSLNQFLLDYPTFLSDRGFNQSLRLNINGTVGDNVHVEATLDDTIDLDKDPKMLLKIESTKYDITAGLMTLTLPGTKYLLFNKKALGAEVTIRDGMQDIIVLAGRPQGDSARDFFAGKGSEQEYIVHARPVVQGSEVAELDGRLLVRGTDYDFDYQDGTLRLNMRLLPVEPTSHITIEYESLATGTGFESTILGVRDVIYLNKRPPLVRSPLAPLPGNKSGAYAGNGGPWGAMSDGHSSAAPTVETTGPFPMLDSLAGRHGESDPNSATTSVPLQLSLFPLLDATIAAATTVTTGPPPTQLTTGTPFVMLDAPVGISTGALLPSGGVTLTTNPAPFLMLDYAPITEPIQSHHRHGDGNPADSGKAKPLLESVLGDSWPNSASTTAPASLFPLLDAVLAGTSGSITDTAATSSFAMLDAALPPGIAPVPPPPPSQFPLLDSVTAVSPTTGTTSPTLVTGPPKRTGPLGQWVPGAPSGFAGGVSHGAGGNGNGSGSFGYGGSFGSSGGATPGSNGTNMSDLYSHLNNNATTTAPATPANNGAGTLPTTSATRGGNYPGGATSAPNALAPDHVAFSAVTSIDTDSGAADSTTTATPQRLTVVGSDFSYKFAGGWYISGEAAYSFLDANTRIENPDVRGSAFDFEIGRKVPGLDLQLTHQQLEPGFAAIGKTDFVQLGEQSDLTSDLRLTALTTRWDLTKKLFLDSLLETSHSNLGNDPTKPIVDYFAIANLLTWSPWNGAKFSVRERDDSNDQLLDLTPTDGTHKVRSGSYTQNLGDYQAQIRAEYVTDVNDPVTTPGQVRTFAASVGNGTKSSFKWTLNAQDVEGYDTTGFKSADAISLEAMVDVNLSRRANFSLSLLTRDEISELTNSHQTVDTGEFRARYQPSDTWNITLKESAEERDSILIVNLDPRLNLVPLDPTQPQTLATNGPVLTLNGSDVVEWHPSKEWDNRFSIRHNQTTELDDDVLLSQNEAAGYRLKWAPGSIFRTTTEIEVGKVYSQQANLDRDTRLFNQELLWALRAGTNLTLSYNDNDQVGLNNTTGERTTVDAISLEQIIDRYFTALSKLSHTHHADGGETGENTIGCGVRYSPPKSNLRLQLDGELGHVTGINVLAEPVNSDRHKITLKVNGKVTQDLNVEVTSSIVKTGPDAQGDTGYNAWTLQSKVFIDF